MLSVFAVLVLAAPASLELDIPAVKIAYRPMGDATKSSVLGASLERAPLERAEFSDVCAVQPSSVSSCLAVLEASLKKAPGDRDATVLRLADAYAQRARVTEALTMLKALKRPSPPSRLLEARLLRANGEIAKSATAWTQAITTSSLQEREPMVLEALQVASEWLDESVVTNDTKRESAARLVWTAGAPYLDAQRASAARARFFDPRQSVKDTAIDEAFLTTLAEQRVLASRGAIRACAEKTAPTLTEVKVEWVVTAKGVSTVSGVEGCLQKALGTVRFATDRPLRVRWRFSLETNR